MKEEGTETLVVGKVSDILIFSETSSDSLMEFGRTQIHSSHGKTVRISNPTDHAVYFKLLDDRQQRLPERAETPFYLLPSSEQGITIEPHSFGEIGPIFFSPTSVSKVCRGLLLLPSYFLSFAYLRF